MTSVKSPTRNYWIFLVLLGLLFGLLMIEVLLRITFDDVSVSGSYWGTGAFEHYDSVGYRHRPGFKGRAFRAGAFDSYVEISQEGLRQKNLQNQLKLSRRVLILGDSYTFGLGVPEESNFVSLIQKNLNPSGIGIVNGGQTGYCTEQEVTFGRELINKFQPGLVILCLFMDNDIEGNYLRDYQNVEVRYGLRLKKNRILRGTAFDYLRTHVYVWRYLDGIWNRRRSNKVHFKFKKLVRKNPEKAIQPSITALKMIQRECDLKGIPLGFVIISSETSEKLFGTSFRRELSTLRVPTLDLPHTDFGKEDTFKTDQHWNEQGHSKAAKHVGEFVRRFFDRS